MKNFILLLPFFVCISCKQKEVDTTKIVAYSNTLPADEIQQDSSAINMLSKQSGEMRSSSGDGTFYNTETYNIIETTFVGNPSKSQVQPMLESVLKNYGKSINDDEILKFANGLLVMRKESKIGVTEMEILKNMYQNYDPKIDMANQLALSATLLELYK